jgi:hypothetical protein
MHTIHTIKEQIKLTISLRDRSLIMGGAVGDKYQILNIFLEPPPIARPLFSRRPHLHLENLGLPTLQHLIYYIFWCKIGNGTSTGIIIV